MMYELPGTAPAETTPAADAGPALSPTPTMASAATRSPAHSRGRIFTANELRFMGLSWSWPPGRLRRIQGNSALRGTPVPYRNRRCERAHRHTASGPTHALHQLACPPSGEVRVQPVGRRRPGPHRGSFVVR